MPLVFHSTLVWPEVQDHIAVIMYISGDFQQILRYFQVYCVVSAMSLGARIISICASFFTLRSNRRWDRRHFAVQLVYRQQFSAKSAIRRPLAWLTIPTLDDCTAGEYSLLPREDLHQSERHSCLRFHAPEAALDRRRSGDE